MKQFRESEKAKSTTKRTFKKDISSFYLLDADMLCKLVGETSKLQFTDRRKSIFCLMD